MTESIMDNKSELIQQVAQNPKTVHAITAGSLGYAGFSEWMQLNGTWVVAFCGLLVSIFLAYQQYKTSRIIRAREMAQTEEINLRNEEKRREIEERKAKNLPLRRGSDLL